MPIVSRFTHVLVLGGWLTCLYVPAVQAQNPLPVPPVPPVPGPPSVNNPYGQNLGLSLLDQVGYIFPGGVYLPSGSLSSLYGMPGGYGSNRYQTAPPQQPNPSQQENTYRPDKESPQKPISLPDERALVEVLLPSPNAEVWLDGAEIKGNGLSRRFLTPELNPGVRYRLRVVAAWIENGRKVFRNQMIEVRMGDTARVNFASGADANPYRSNDDEKTSGNR